MTKVESITAKGHDGITKIGNFINKCRGHYNNCFSTFLQIVKL